MNRVDVEPFVKSLGIPIPPLEEFWKLGDLTGLRQNKDGRFYRANYERGILLYALVAKYRPQTILEFGTGRGYGCLCMAWSMEDHKIPGCIYTIDQIPQEESFPWAIDWGKGPTIEKLARSEVWPKAALASWITRIKVLTGWAGQVMRRYQGPKIEMAFIDGGHDYEAVCHDFYSVLQVAADRFGILFDDYAPKPGFGIQKLIDDKVVPYFDATLIYTDRRWPGGERATIKSPEYGMVWIHSDNLKKGITSVCDAGTVAEILRNYRFKEYWKEKGYLLRKTIKGRLGLP